MFYQQEKFTNKHNACTQEKMVRLHLETITITDQKCLTSLPVTWFQLDGMIWISKTINFATAANYLENNG